MKWMAVTVYLRQMSKPSARMDTRRGKYKFSGVIKSSQSFKLKNKTKKQCPSILVKRNLQVLPKFFWHIPWRSERTHFCLCNPPNLFTAWTDLNYWLQCIFCPSKEVHAGWWQSRSMWGIKRISSCFFMLEAVWRDQRRPCNFSDVLKICSNTAWQVNPSENYILHEMFLETRA